MSLPLHHQVIGHGPPLIVLHGLFGSGTNWRSVARALADYREVHLLDLRNHGRSPHAKDMSYALIAGDVAAYMDRQKMETATLLGHSMGGKAAMRLALDAPDRVSDLVVVDVAPVASGGDHLPYIEAMRSLKLADLARREAAAEMLADSIPDAGLRQFLLQNLERSDAGFRWRLNLDGIAANMEALHDFPVDAANDRYVGPALFIRGGDSDYVRREHYAVIRRYFPGAEIATVADAGHWLHAERPDAFLEVVKPFLGTAR